MLDQPQPPRASVQPRSELALSGPMKVDLSIYRGDTGAFRITVTDPDGNPADLTGATWDGDIRLKSTDPTVVTSFDIVPVTGDVSSVDVTLPADKSDLVSKSCVYDIEMRIGTPEVVTTLIYGNISVTQDVSRPDTE